MTSVLMITDAPADRVQNAFVNLRETFPQVELYEGQRPYRPAPAEAA